MQEQQYQLNLYSFFQKLVYAIVAFDCISLFYGKANIPVLSNLLQGLIKTGFIYPPINAKFATLIFITLVAIGTKAKKKKELNITANIIVPVSYTHLTLPTTPYV